LGVWACYGAWGCEVGIGAAWWDRPGRRHCRGGAVGRLERVVACAQQLEGSGWGGPLRLAVQTPRGDTIGHGRPVTPGRHRWPRMQAGGCRPVGPAVRSGAGAILWWRGPALLTAA
jgi:hypothetical protein